MVMNHMVALMYDARYVTCHYHPHAHLRALHSTTESHNLNNSYLAVSSLFQRANQLGDEEIF